MCGIGGCIDRASALKLLLCIEYIGAIPMEKRGEVIQELNREANRLVQVCA